LKKNIQDNSDVNVNDNNVINNEDIHQSKFKSILSNESHHTDSSKIEFTTNNNIYQQKV